MNFGTIKQELNKKIKNMSEEDFIKFIKELERIYYSKHSHKHSNKFNKSESEEEK